MLLVCCGTAGILLHIFITLEPRLTVFILWTVPGHYRRWKGEHKDLRLEVTLAKASCMLYLTSRVAGNVGTYPVPGRRGARNTDVLSNFIYPRSALCPSLPCSVLLCLNSMDCITRAPRPSDSRFALAKRVHQEESRGWGRAGPCSLCSLLCQSSAVTVLL